MNKKNILIIAYHFPPVGGLGAAGSQRALKFARHLPATGWHPTILTVREDSYESYLTIDRSLSIGIADETPVIRTKVLRGLEPFLRIKNSVGNLFVDRTAKEISHLSTPVMTSNSNVSRFQKLKDAITDLFEIPDEVAGWFLPAFLAGTRVIRRKKIDIIFATGRPWTSLVVGAALKTISGKKLVVDFRDPWMTNPFRLDYSSFKNRAEKVLEKWVLKKADLVVANTDYLRSEFIQRFGNDMEEKCVTVLNGYDRDEFAGVIPSPRSTEIENSFLITHSGFLYGKRDPSRLLQAISLLRDRQEIRQGEFICHFVGKVELPYDLDRYIQEKNLEAYVHQIGQLPYSHSLASLASCDLALLLQPGTSTQIPSKLFEYVGLGKNILTIAPADSAVANMVVDNNLGDIAEPDDVESIADALSKNYRAWKENNQYQKISPDVQAIFDVKRSVSKLGAELDRIVDTKSGPV